MKKLVLALTLSFLSIHCTENNEIIPEIKGEQPTFLDNFFNSPEAIIKSLVVVAAGVSATAKLFQGMQRLDEQDESMSYSKFLLILADAIVYSYVAHLATKETIDCCNKKPTTNTAKD